MIRVRFQFVHLAIALFLSARALAEPALPWGRLTEIRIFLEASDAALANFPHPASKTQWRFPGQKYEEVMSFLRLVLAENEIFSSETPHIEIQELEGEVRAYPDREFLLALTADERKRIYSELARHRENPFHWQPVFIQTHDVRQWFRPLSLSSKAMAIVESLVYPVGTSWAFSDVPLLLSTATTDLEEIAIRRALTRNYTLLLELNFDAQDATNETLKEYWTVNGTYESAALVFESFARDNSPSSFDLNQLLPPVPRKFFSNYPTLRDGASGTFPNGFWTSLNFFSFLPDPAFSDPVEAMQYLEDRFVTVSGERRYGDVILLRDRETDRPVHAAVYLANEIVYTKNGPSILEPWITMKLPHVVDRFSVQGKPQIETWRRKTATTGATPDTRNSTEKKIVAP